MSHSLSSAMPGTGRRPDDHRPPADPPPRGRAPVVERIAAWSARHRKTAVLGWLVMVVAVFFVGTHVGTSNVNSYDPGQSGQAEQTLSRLHIKSSPPAESVLIQARSGGGTFATDRQLRAAARQVV